MTCPPSAEGTAPSAAASGGPREQVAEILRERARSLASRSRKREPHPRHRLRVLEVISGSERCGISLDLVQQVVAAVPITPVPGAVPVLRGVAEVHGQIRSVFDLAALLGARAVPPWTTAGFFVLTRCHDGKVILHVDHVQAVRSLDRATVVLSDAARSEQQCSPVAGLADDNLLIVTADSFRLDAALTATE